MAGSGYFVPYYTPASPYLNGLKVAEETAYSTGRHDGFVSGYDAASAQNHNSSYNSGWHDGYPIVKKKTSLSAMNTIPATRSAMIRAGMMGGMPVTMTDWPMDIRMPMMRVTMLDIQTVLMNTINALLVFINAQPPPAVSSRRGLPCRQKVRIKKQEGFFPCVACPYSIARFFRYGQIKAPGAGTMQRRG